MTNNKSFNPMHWKSRFFSWSKKKQSDFIQSLPPAAALSLRYCSDFWLRDKQIVDRDDWRVYVIKAGRGFGKTKAGACWMKKCIENHEPVSGRHDLYAMCGPTHADVVKVMVPALMNEFGPDERRKIQWNKTEGTLMFPNGAIVYCYSSETEIRGPNIAKAWVDELAKWWNADEQYEIFKYAVRIGEPQILITTTPKKNIKTLRQLISKNLEDPAKYVIVEGSSFENTALPEAYRQELEDMRNRGQKFRQEALGELISDTEDALWSETNISDNRVQSNPDAFNEQTGHKINLPKDVELVRIVVAIDPAGTANPDSDETGIVVAAIDGKGHGYLLDDASGRYSPDGWATKAVQLYHDYQANIIIAEKNFGGDMVENTIHTIDPQCPIKLVRASHGKVVRADPVSSKYANGMVHHVGSAKRFERLEDQMCVFTGAPSTNKRKDDRLDAMVWAFTDLLISPIFVPRSFINLPNFG